MQIPERIIKANEALENLKIRMSNIAESATAAAEGINQFVEQVREIQMAQIPESEVAQYKSKLLEHAVREFAFTDYELSALTHFLSDERLRRYVFDKVSFDWVLNAYCLICKSRFERAVIQRVLAQN